MLDGNMEALRAYERKVDFVDGVQSSFDREMKPMIKALEKAVNDIYLLVQHYEDEYNLDFKDDALETMKDIIGAV